MNKPAIKNGIAGILYRTSAPKLLVEKPIAKENIRLNTKQNMTSGILLIVLNMPIKPVFDIARYNIYRTNIPSNDESSINGDLTSHKKGRKIVVIIAKGAILSICIGVGVAVTPISNVEPSSALRFAFNVAALFVRFSN